MAPLLTRNAVVAAEKKAICTYLDIDGRHRGDGRRLDIDGRHRGDGRRRGDGRGAVTSQRSASTTWIDCEWRFHKLNLDLV